MHAEQFEKRTAIFCCFVLNGSALNGGKGRWGEGEVTQE
jgi:hypothetical protein